MPDPTFTFTFKVTASDATVTTFDVLTFEGEERISQPFEYRLTLKHPDVLSDFGKVVNQSAELVMEQGFDGPSDPPVRLTTTVRVAGIVSSFRAKQRFVVTDGPDYVAYEAVLVPKFWRLGLFHQSRIFQRLTVEEIIGRVFAQEVSPGVPALGTDDYDFKLEGTYEPRDFCVQYRESDLDFIQRLMEHEGMYYFFDGGKLIITDSKTQAEPESATTPRNVSFSEGTGGTMLVDDVIYRFRYDEQIVPRAVKVRDYDYEAFANSEKGDSETAKANAGSSAAGQEYARVGTHYEHGLFSEKRHFDPFAKSDDPDVYSAYCDAEVKRKARVERIADVRAQELEARRVSGEGKSNVLRLRAGHVFKFIGDFPFPDGTASSREFLVTSLHHRYRPIEIDGAESTSSVYRNTFVCLPSALQYRPARVTPIPRVPGVMTAKVVAEPEPVAPTPPDPNDRLYVLKKVQYDQDKKKYDEDIAKYRACKPFEGPIDKEGKYRLEIPFDEADQPVPSKRVRLAQPHAGTDYGFHFPNRPNTEMVFACVDGDPDRPLGLSMVANPWTHSPVPTTEHQLRSQNPWTGSSTGSATTYDEYKNVIRSARGHQLVMDDNEGGSNVGITLQAGKVDNSTGRNIYWNSRIEMGGYRHLSGLERVLGIISTATGYFRSAFTRDLPGMASEALGIVASQVTTNNYADDTFGTTTPVGIGLSTDKDIVIKGGDGVNITSPNLFGMFSSNLVGDDADQKEGQYRAEAISKFLSNIIFQELMNGTIDEIKDSRDATKAYKKEEVQNPKTASTFKWNENFKEQRISALFFTLLQRTGVNIFSAGELKMASLQSTSIAAGQGGMALKSFGSIEQKADLGVEISSHEGISIKTKGRSYQGKGVWVAVRKLADSVKNPVLQGFLSQLQTKFSNVGLDKDDDFKIDIHNENGDVFIHTGAPTVPPKPGEQPTPPKEGDIMAHVEGKGDIKAFVNEGEVHQWSSGKEGTGITLEVGSRDGLKNDAALDPLLGSRAKARFVMGEQVMHGFSAKRVQFVVDKDYEKEGSAITIEEGQIEIKCGESSLVMKKDGTITLEGKDITMKGSGNIKVEGTQITSKAQSKHSVEGGQVDVKAGGIANLEGQGVNVKASALTTIKGGMTKIG